jgi:hypothetical protein
MSCKCCCDSKELIINKCPVCGNDSIEVSKKTMESLLIEDIKNKISDNQYYFCAKPHCDVVYFNDKERFYKKNLKINIDDKVCFCFNISKDEIEKIGKEKVLEKIQNNMKEKGCNCEVNNPSGKCCTIQIKKNY